MGWVELAAINACKSKSACALFQPHPPLQLIHMTLANSSVTVQLADGEHYVLGVVGDNAVAWLTKRFPERSLKSFVGCFVEISKGCFAKNNGRVILSVTEWAIVGGLLGGTCDDSFGRRDVMESVGVKQALTSNPVDWNDDTLAPEELIMKDTQTDDDDEIPSDQEEIINHLVDQYRKRHGSQDEASEGSNGSLQSTSGDEQGESQSKAEVLQNVSFEDSVNTQYRVGVNPFSRRYSLVSAENNTEFDSIQQKVPKEDDRSEHAAVQENQPVEIDIRKTISCGKPNVESGLDQETNITVYDSGQETMQDLESNIEKSQVCLEGANEITMTTSQGEFGQGIDTQQQRTHVDGGIEMEQKIIVKERIVVAQCEQVVVQTSQHELVCGENMFYEQELVNTQNTLPRNTLGDMDVCTEDDCVDKDQGPFATKHENEQVQLEQADHHEQVQESPSTKRQIDLINDKNENISNNSSNNNTAPTKPAKRVSLGAIDYTKWAF